MSIPCVALIISVFLFCVHKGFAHNYVNSFGKSYSKDWVLFYDAEHQQVRYINMTQKPTDLDVAGRRFDANIQFRLFTRSNPHIYEEISTKKNAPRSQYFNASNKVKVIAHGWMSSAEADAFIFMKDAYLNKQNVNVILVNWAEISENPMYPFVSMRTTYVGEQVAEMLHFLHHAYGVPYEAMHLIGHSLGAHVMGDAGMNCNSKIGRITGLDPARPLYELPPMSPQYTLDPSDAVFVDVIHTCGGLLGVMESFGHADFYPNGGIPSQPGCDGMQLELEACSHSRANFLFTESITNGQSFQSFGCDSWNEYESGNCGINNAMFMGELAWPRARGKYYLKTNERSLYGMGWR